MNGNLLALSSVAALAAGAALSRAGSRDHTALDLAKAKILRKKTVFHVGASVAAQKQAHRGGKPDSSYEGEGLSVSEHPRAWTKIAQLGGSPTWTLTRADGQSGQFVDMHALRASPGVRRRIDAFLVDAGWIVPKTAYTVTWFDDDLDREVTMRFETRAEAEAEFEGLEPEDRPIRPSMDWGPTARLIARWAMHFSGTLHPGMAWDYAFLCALDEVAPSLDVDGAWWKDDLDPRGYSAPRGVILPSRIGAWTWRFAQRGEGDDVDSKHAILLKAIARWKRVKTPPKKGSRARRKLLPDFWFEDGFDPAVRAFIEKQPRIHGPSCQDESRWWARALRGYIDPFRVEVHDGTFGKDQDGHTWIDVDGRIFDPTASQFGTIPDVDDYVVHEVHEAPTGSRARPDKDDAWEDG